MIYRHTDRFLHALSLRNRREEVTDVETWLADHLPRLGKALGMRLSAAPDTASYSDHLHRLVARNDDDGSVVYIVACADDFDEVVIIKTLVDPVARVAQALVWIAGRFEMDALTCLRQMNADADDGEDRYFAVAVKGIGGTAVNSAPQFNVMVSA